MGEGLGKEWGRGREDGGGGLGRKEREEGKERAGHWLPASGSLLVSG